MPKLKSLRELRFVEPKDVKSSDEVLQDAYSPLFDTTTYRQVAERLERSPDYTCRRSQERTVLVSREIWNENSGVPYEEFAQGRSAEYDVSNEITRRLFATPSKEAIDINFDISRRVDLAPSQGIEDDYSVHTTSDEDFLEFDDRYKIFSDEDKET